MLQRTGERVRDGRKSSGGSGGSGSSSMLVSGGSSEPEIVSSTTNIASTGSGGSGGDDKSVAGAIATGVRDSVIFSGSLLQSSLSQEGLIHFFLYLHLGILFLMKFLFSRTNCKE